MTRHIFTVKGYQELQKALGEARKNLKRSMLAKGKAASKQDGWHGSEFQSIAVQERLNSKRLGELQELSRNAKVVERLEEQNKVVKIGNGVLIKREDGSEGRFILGGYRVDLPSGHISVESPLGKALILAKVGEKRTFWLGKDKRTVTVRKIALPSGAESFVQENLHK